MGIEARLRSWRKHRRRYQEVEISTGCSSVAQRGAGLLLMVLAVFSAPVLAQTAEWKPSSELTEGAEATLRDFLKAKDRGDYEAAYGMFNPGLQAMLPLAAFVEQAQLFAKQSGPLIERKPIRTTWYPNAGNAQPLGPTSLSISALGFRTSTAIAAMSSCI